MNKFSHIFFGVWIVLSAHAMYGQIETDALDEVLIIDSIQGQWEKSSQYTSFLSDSLGYFLATGFNIDNVLEQVSGLYMRSYGGHGGVKTLSVRGFSAQQTTLSINGIPFRNVQNSLINLNQVYLQGYRKVEVSKVARSIAQNTLGGNIDLEVAPQKQLSSVQLAGGSFGEWLANAGLEGKLKKTAYRLGYAYLQAEDNYPFNLNGESGKRQHTAFQTQQYQAFVQHSFSPKLEISGMLSGNFSQQEIPGPVLTGNPSSSEDDLEQQSLFSFIQTKLQFSPRSRFSTSLSYQFDGLDYDNLGRLQEYRLHDGLLQLQYDWLGINHSLRANIQANYSKLLGNNLAIDFLPVSQVDRRALNLGLKHQWTFPLGKGQLLGESIFRLNGVDEFGWLPNGGLNLNWMLGAKQQIWEFYTHLNVGNRIPSFNELYYFGFGNSDLVPESVQSVDFGVSWKPAWKQLQLSLTAFANRTQNKIISVPINPARWQSFSIGKTETTGIEGEFSFAPIKNSRVYASYTLQEAIDRTRNGRPLLPYTPKEIFAYGMNYQWGAFTLLLNAVYSGWRFSLLQNDRDTFLPAYHLLDASVRYKLSLGRTFLLTSLEAENLLNESYVVIRSYPMPTRSGRLRISFHF